MTLALGQLPQINILCKWANLHKCNLLWEPCQTTIHSYFLSFPWQRLLQFLGYDTKIFLLTIPCPLLLTVNILRAGSSCFIVCCPLAALRTGSARGVWVQWLEAPAPPPSWPSPHVGLDYWVSQDGLFCCTAFLESNSAMKNIKSGFAFWPRSSVSGISTSGDVCIWS